MSQSGGLKRNGHDIRSRNLIPPPPEDVTFQSEDGLTLAGWFFPGSKTAAIILVHGKDANRQEMLPHAAYLQRAGFSTLLFDARGRGESGGDMVTFGAKEPLDMKGAVDYLKTRSDVDKIGVQGISLGAVSAIMAAADLPDIQGVVAESAFADLQTAISDGFSHVTGLPGFPFANVAKLICECRIGVDLDTVSPVKAIAVISPRPVFLIHDEHDAQLTANSLEAMWEAAREPRYRWIVPAATHGKGWQSARKEYAGRVVRFWEQTFVNTSRPN